MQKQLSQKPKHFTQIVNNFYSSIFGSVKCLPAEEIANRKVSRLDGTADEMLKANNHMSARTPLKLFYGFIHRK